MGISEEILNEARAIVDNNVDCKDKLNKYYIRAVNSIAALIYKMEKEKEKDG